MLSLDLKNLHKVDKKHGLSKKEVVSVDKRLPTYLKRFYSRDQHFHEIVDDMAVVREIEGFVRETKGKFDHVIVLGIGGSALGTICLQKALKPLYAHEMKGQKWPNVHVIDNVDPTFVREIEAVLNLKRTLFVVVSKSGRSPEPVSLFMYFKDKLQRAKLPVKKHMVAVTGPDDNFLRRACGESGIRTFLHPDVGGRYSVLSMVGLLPAALSGINIRKLLAGGRAMRDLFISDNPKKNLPWRLATIQYLMEQKGKPTNVLMPYSQRLQLFPDWFLQLLAESIGKEEDRNGKMVYAGLNPVRALGVTDQHSQIQLYNEGPNDKLIMLIEVMSFGKQVMIPTLYPKEESVQYLKGVSFNKLINTEKRATADSYTKYQRPNVTIKVDRVDEETMGQLFLLFEGATAFLGEFYNVNAFNQPGVELSKILTRKYLKKK